VSAFRWNNKGQRFMDQHRFDQVTRRMASGTSRRRVLGGLAGALVGGVALTTGGDARKSSKAKNKEKVLICHKPGTPAQKEKRVPQSAVKGHKRHGDTEGPCPNSPCGKCGKGETCIGGGTIGGTTFPVTCCPAGKTCGGPTADVMICCSAAQTCTGTIPNQQCVAA
jgi:hypothetical protein